MNENIEYMRTIPLVQALWWAIENIEPAEHTEEFFYLRERYRNEEQLEEVLADGRNKGWALAKSLQTQVDILLEAMTEIAHHKALRGTAIGPVSIAIEALAKIKELKEK